MTADIVDEMVDRVNYRRGWPVDPGGPPSCPPWWRCGVVLADVAVPGAHLVTRRLDADAVEPPVGRMSGAVAEHVLAVQLLGDGGGRRRELLRRGHHFGAAAAFRGDLSQRLDVHPRVDW